LHPFLHSPILSFEALIVVA